MEQTTNLLLQSGAREELPALHRRLHAERNSPGKYRNTSVRTQIAQEVHVESQPLHVYFKLSITCNLKSHVIFHSKWAIVLSDSITSGKNVATWVLLRPCRVCPGPPTPVPWPPQVAPGSPVTAQPAQASVLAGRRLGAA